jgi:hypothetical protein
MPRWGKVVLGFVLGTMAGAVQMSSHWSQWQITTEQAGLMFDPTIASVRLMAGAIVWGAAIGVIVWCWTGRQAAAKKRVSVPDRKVTISPR